MNSHITKKFSEIKSPYAEYNLNLYGFLNNIPADLLGLMKIHYEAQISFFYQNPKGINETENYFINQPYGPITIYTREVKTKNL